MTWHISTELLSIKDLKFICFTNPFLHSLSRCIRTALYWTYTRLTRHWHLFFLFSSFIYFSFLVTCARLSWSHSAFLVHVKLSYHILSFCVIKCTCNSWCCLWCQHWHERAWNIRVCVSSSIIHLKVETIYCFWFFSRLLWWIWKIL